MDDPSMATGRSASLFISALCAFCEDTAHTGDDTRFEVFTSWLKETCALRGERFCLHVLNNHSAILFQKLVFACSTTDFRIVSLALRVIGILGGTSWSCFNGLQQMHPKMLQTVGLVALEKSDLPDLVQQEPLVRVAAFECIAGFASHGQGLEWIISTFSTQADVTQAFDTLFTCVNHDSFFVTGALTSLLTRILSADSREHILTLSNHFDTMLTTCVPCVPRALAIRALSLLETVFKSLPHTTTFVLSSSTKIRWVIHQLSAQDVEIQELALNCFVNLVSTLDQWEWCIDAKQFLYDPIHESVVKMLQSACRDDVIFGIKLLGVIGSVKNQVAIEPFWVCLMQLYSPMLSRRIDRQDDSALSQVLNRVDDRVGWHLLESSVLWKHHQRFVPLLLSICVDILTSPKSISIHKSSLQLMEALIQQVQLSDLPQSFIEDTLCLLANRYVSLETLQSIIIRVLIKVLEIKSLSFSVPSSALDPWQDIVVGSATSEDWAIRDGCVQISQRILLLIQKDSYAATVDTADNLVKLSLEDQFLHLLCTFLKNEDVYVRTSAIECVSSIPLLLQRSDSYLNSTSISQPLSGHLNIMTTLMEVLMAEYEMVPRKAILESVDRFCGAWTQPENFVKFWTLLTSPVVFNGVDSSVASSVSPFSVLCRWVDDEDWQIVIKVCNVIGRFLDCSRALSANQEAVLISAVAALLGASKLNQSGVRFAVYSQKDVVSHCLEQSTELVQLLAEWTQVMADIKADSSMEMFFSPNNESRVRLFPDRVVEDLLLFEEHGVMEDDAAIDCY